MEIYLQFSQTGVSQTFVPAAHRCPELVVPEFGVRQASHHFSTRAPLNLSDGPFRHDLQGGVWLGLFNVTAELYCLLSELTKRP